MSEAPIDLIVPYYGARALLEETVLSVLEQSSPHWRLTIVEDGDQGYGVGTWIRGLKDERVHHVLNPKNLGVSGNFQRCLDQAAGDFVSFPGCDDRLSRHYVRDVRLGWGTFQECVAVIPGVVVVDELGLPARSLTDWVKSRLRPRSGEYSGEALMASLMHGNWTYFPATCWRTRAIKRWGFRADLPITLDLALLANLVLDGNSIAVLDEQLFEYRRHRHSASSLSAAEGKRFAEERALFSELAERASNLGWDRAARAARWHLTSRAHALARLPLQLRRGEAAPLLRHGLTPVRASRRTRRR
jgi:glycosyltransferase involved in cell wall biosynthesis